MEHVVDSECLASIIMCQNKHSITLKELRVDLVIRMTLAHVTEGNALFELAPGFRYVTGLAMRRAKRMLVASDKRRQPRAAKLPRQSIAPMVSFICTA
jgi:hypothetical protein